MLLYDVKQKCFTNKNMKVEENVYLGKLFDAYGKLLSKGQQEIMDLYLNDDLTLSEIASNLNVSRQAILDSISKGEKKLKGYEEELKLLERIERLEEEIRTLKQLSKSRR